MDATEGYKFRENAFRKCVIHRSTLLFLMIFSFILANLRVWKEKLCLLVAVVEEDRYS